MSRVAGSLMLAGALVAVLAFGVAPVGATHDPDLSDAEVSCQLNTAKVFSKLVSSRATCRIKCEQAQFNGALGKDCFKGDDGGYDTTTAACFEAARMTAKNGEHAKCAADCPECYTGGGDCSDDFDKRFADVETQLAMLAPLIYCAAPPTAGELKCEFGVHKNAAKLAGSLSKCSQKCILALHKGDTSRVCSGDLDATTKGCQDAALAKAGPAIDNACKTKPACGLHSLDGAGWATTVAATLSASGASYFCGE